MAAGDIKGFVEVAGPLFTETVLQATAAEVVAGTENAKLVTPKNLKDAEFIAIHVGTSAPTDTTKLWIDTN